MRKNQEDTKNNFQERIYQLRQNLDTFQKKFDLHIGISKNFVPVVLASLEKMYRNRKEIYDEIFTFVKYIVQVSFAMLVAIISLNDNLFSPPDWLPWLLFVTVIIGIAIMGRMVHEKSKILNKANNDIDEQMQILNDIRKVEIKQIDVIDFQSEIDQLESEIKKMNT